MQSLLNGRTPGVTLLANSGVVGAGSTVRIRGVSSFSLTNQPLIYVDGVRVDNSQSTGVQQPDLRRRDHDALERLQSR